MLGYRCIEKNLQKERSDKKLSLLISVVSLSYIFSMSSLNHMQRLLSLEVLSQSERLGSYSAFELNPLVYNI